MKLYRTTRYGWFGGRMWQRLSTTRLSYGATKSEVNTYGYRGGVTLEMMEVDESQFKLVETAGKVPEQ